MVKKGDELDVMSINEKTDVGYILEVDLEYPRELHELHNDYPLAPEKLAVTNDMLSKYCKEVVDKYDITTKGVNIATEFNEFKDVSFNKRVMRHKMKRIQGKKHKTGTYKIDKISLSCLDDKRYVLDDGVNTLAYFHKDCNKNVMRSMVIKIIKINDNKDQ